MLMRRAVARTIFEEGEERIIVMTDIGTESNLPITFACLFMRIGAQCRMNDDDNQTNIFLWLKCNARKS